MLVRFDTLEPWKGERLGVDEILYSSDIEYLWSPADLAAIGLGVPSAFVAPTGYHTVGQPGYEVQNGALVTVFDVEADVPVVPYALTRWQFFTVAAMSGLITEEAALASIQTGTLPAQFVAFIESMPLEQRFPAKAMLAGVTEFHRHHPFVQAFLVAQNMSDAQADAIWTAGATLGLAGQ